MSMSKLFKQLGLLLGLVFTVQSAWSFSLLGPQEENYQVAALGYEAPNFGFTYPPANWVKNLDDEYRLNTKVIYYSYDAEFTSYFGSNGIAAVDAAFEILNNLTNVSDYSADLTEFPLESKSVNYTAQALNLFDLKSYALQEIVSRYGLATPDHFTWTLRNRALPPNAQCPEFSYSVIQRNFDPITWEPTAYVNGNLFTYQIIELCPDTDVASAEEVLVDPLATIGSAVASQALFLGDFYRGLTRDDVGGMRYMLSTNNINWETSPTNAFVRATNTSQAVLLFPSNLQLFAEQSLTNDGAELEGLYPGLDVTGTSNYFVNVVTTNFFSYETNYAGEPVGSPPQVVFGSFLTTNVETRYVHSVGNTLTNQFFTNCTFSLLTTNIAPPTYAPPGSGFSVTNVTLQTFEDDDCISGSFFILPTNICDYQILSTQLTEVVTSTNLLTNTVVTNIVSDTNSGTADYYEFSQSVVRYFTNQILTAYPVSCPDGLTSLFEGIEKVTFVRRDFDSLLGQFFQPVTNNFTLTEITNNTRVTRYVERSISSPDMLFAADDITSEGTDLPRFATASLSVPNYSTNTANVRGPGTISPRMFHTLNKVGPYLINSGPSFVTEASAFRGYRWGSFDGTTNAPIVYPVGTDLQSLESLVVINLTQPSAVTNGSYLLPDGTNGVPYNGGGFQLEVIGGQPPYSWDTSPSNLPEGLSVSAGGLVSGTPTAAGTYDFSIRMTDAAARFVDFPFTLTILP